MYRLQKLRLIVLFSVALFHSISGKTQTGKYPIKNFAPEDYGAGIQNIDFAQNRDLTVFVANNLGVLSFNGVNWGKYALQTGKKQRSLAFSENENRLYVGSQGEFGYFEGNWIYKSLLDKIAPEHKDFDEVWDVHRYDSKVYFCTFQGIFEYESDTVHVIKHEKGFNRTFLAGNRLFTQIQSGELVEVKEGKIHSIDDTSDRAHVVVGIIRNETGYAVFYNSGKIKFLNSVNLPDSYSKLIKVLEGKYVNHVTQISDGRLVISTQREGLFIFNEINNEIENISKADGLMSNACLRVFQDHSGSLWVGMQNGMSLIDINSPLRLINQNIGIQGSGYEAFEREEGTYYTTSNGIYFLRGNASTALCEFLEGTEGPAYGMQVINKKLYAGHHTGLFLLENGKAIRRATCDGLWQIKPLQNNPGYAIGGMYSGILLFETDTDGNLKEIQKISGFAESSRFFEEDNRGRIWVGQYYKGLYRITLSDKLRQANVVKDEQIYIGTPKGILVLDQASDKIIEDKEFSKIVGSSWIYLLQQDKNKNVYVYAENHVGHFKQVSTGNYVYVPSSIFQLRQLFNNDLLSVSRQVKNGVLFNANEGFIQYIPELENSVTLQEEPIISRVYSVAEDSTLYRRMPFTEKPTKVSPIVISEGTKVLQFTVESFKYRDISHQQFRYYLQGFDETYSTWTTTNVKEYTNLKPGTYTFWVEAYNSSGEIIKSKPLVIRVNPFFYKTTWARFIYFILVLIGLYIFYRIQRRYYKAKQAKLEQAKQQELALKQKELQALKEDQIKSELSHVNSLLAASTMNLVVKNEFMENVKEEIREALSTDKPEEKQKALERIIKEIDTTLKVQEDWKQFEYNFDRVHGDFLKRLTTEFTDLTPGEQKLCAFLRLNMDSKEIANLMGISLRGVEVSRYRLRKKFNLETQQNLAKFILEY
jgi:DNA-binding CsgD family transcriptional regulator